MENSTEDLELQSPIYESQEKPETTSPDVSFTDATKIAFNEFTVAGAAIKGVEEVKPFERDPKYWETDNELKSQWYLDGLTHESQRYVAEARSDEEAEWRRDRALEWDANQKVIEEQGISGMILPTVVAALGDPSTYLFGVGELKALGTLAKLGFAEKAAVGAAFGTAYEMPQYMVNPHTDATDLVLGAAMGGIISGVLPIGKTGQSVSDEEIKSQLVNRDASIQEVQQTSAGAAQVKGSVIAREDGTTMEEEEILNAMVTRTDQLDSESTVKEDAITRGASKIFGLLDFSVTGGFKKSAREGNEVSNWVAKDILSDASGEYTRGVSASDIQHGLSTKYTEKAVLEYGDVADDWITQNVDLTKMEQLGDLPRFQRAMEMFDEKVYAHMQHRYLNYGNDGYDDWLSKQDQHVVAAANKLDDNYKTILSDRKLSGEAGFATIEHKPGYLPRIMDSTAIQNSRENAYIYKNMFGEEFERLAMTRHKLKLEDLEADLTSQKLKLKEIDDVKAKETVSKQVAKTEQAIKDLMNKLDNVDSAKYKSAGKNFYDNLVRTGLGHQTTADDIFRTTDIDSLTEMVGDSGVAKELYENFQEAMAESSKSSRAKNRIEFDVNKATADGKHKLSDLYSKNIRQVSSRYGREAAGTVALARKGIKSLHEWREVAKAGAVREKGGGDKYMQTMDDTYNLLLSRPISEAMKRGTRRLNEYTNLTMLGRTGIAQLADFAMVTANNGFMNTVRSSREYMKIRKAINEGTAEDTLLGQIEALGGRIGNDHIMFNPTLDRIGEATDAGSVSKGWAKYDEYSAMASRSLFYLNGMNHIKRFQQRVSSIASANTIVTNALKDNDLARLSSVGIDGEMVRAIKKEHARGNIKLGDKGVTDLNLKGWENIEQAQEFAFAIRKAVASQVQDPLVGEGIMAMHRDIGSLMLKLMAFPILAMQKQLARNFYHHDMSSLALAGYGTMMGMAVYTLNKEIGAVGTDKSGDAWEDFQDDPSKIFIGSLMYNPLAGVLPDFANLTSAMGLMPQEWSPSGAMRGQEGFSNGPSIENIANATPSTQSILAPLRALSLAPRAIAEGEAPERWAYDVQAAMPLGNTIFLGSIFNQLKD